VRGDIPNLDRGGQSESSYNTALAKAVASDNKLYYYLHSNRQKIPGTLVRATYNADTQSMDIEDISDAFKAAIGDDLGSYIDVQTAETLIGHFALSAFILFAVTFGKLGGANWRLTPMLGSSVILSTVTALELISYKKTATRFGALLLAVLCIVSLPAALQIKKMEKDTGDNIAWHLAAERLEDEGIRVTVDARNEKIGYKIRAAQLEKIPFMLVIGEKEMTEGSVAVRSRKTGDMGTMSADDFISFAKKQVADKVLDN
jgi:hypothetical protein